jgi:hypothetical protein
MLHAESPGVERTNEHSRRLLKVMQSSHDGAHSVCWSVYERATNAVVLNISPRKLIGIELWRMWRKKRNRRNFPYNKST